MELIFPIVGVRHCVPEEVIEDFMASLPEGAEVMLVDEPTNAHDRYAIQAWMELEIEGVSRKMQVGYVASDYAPLIHDNYPHGDILHAHVVFPETSNREEDYFEVALEVEHSEYPLFPPRLDSGPIAHIPIPTVPAQKQMAIEEIYRFNAFYAELDAEAVLEEEVVNRMISLAQRSRPYLNHGLSVDERNASIQLSAMLTDLHGFWPQNSDAIWDERMVLEEEHRNAYRTPEQCAQIMEEEMQALKEQSTIFFEQYAGVLAAGLTTREQEIKAHQQWLMALPDNLYVWLKDKPLFASKIYYERFSMEELYALYTHLLCMEWLKNGHEEKLPDFALQAISKFSFWYPRCSWADKRTAIQEWREAVVLTKKPIATLVLRMTQAQKRYVLKQDLEPFTQFVQELNLFLDQPIKENSLRKRYFHNR